RRVTQGRQARADLRSRQVLAGKSERQERRPWAAIGAQQSPSIEDAAAGVVVDHAVPADALVAGGTRQGDRLDQKRGLLIGGDASGRGLRRGGVVVDGAVGFGGPERLLELILRQDRLVDAVHA